MQSIAQRFNAEKAMSLFLWQYTNNQFTKIKNFNPLHFCKKVYIIFRRTLFSKPTISEQPGRQGSVLYLRAYSRKDVDEHSGFYESAIKNTIVCLFFQRQKTFDPGSLIWAIVIFLQKRNEIYVSLRSSKVKLFSQEGLDFVLSFLDALSDLIKIMPYIQRCSQLVSFQEMVPVENLACQIANSYGKATYALQHALGAYTMTGSYRSRYSLIHYKPTVCKAILAWGEYSRKTFQGFTRSSVYLVGKPVLPKINPPYDGVTFIFEIDDKINDKLLELSRALSKKGFEVSRWFKPGHELGSKGVVRDGPLRKMVIGMKSSLLFEFGFLGCFVFVIPESLFVDILPKDLIVNTADQIQKKYLTINSYPHHVWREFIDCTGQESVNRYRQILGSGF